LKENPQQNQNRRELIVRALRYASIGLLAALGGSVFAKRYRLMKRGECVNRDLCADCEFLQDCELPQALSAK
jgi:hypothetical protein